MDHFYDTKIFFDTKIPGEPGYERGMRDTYSIHVHPY